MLSTCSTHSQKNFLISPKYTKLIPTSTIFFIDRALLSAVKSTEYFAIAISDHAPHMLDLALSTISTKQWKFNAGLLAKDEFC